MDKCSKKWIIKVPPLSGKGDKGDKGDPGDDGTLSLPISTDDVLYGSDVLTDVLDALLYQPLTINSFSASPSVYEKGQVLTSIALTWSYNKSVQIQGISGVGVVSPTLVVGDRNKTVTLSNLSTNTTIILTADDIIGDGHAAKTSSIGITFTSKLYWGKAVIPGGINSAFILGLSNNALQTNRTRSFTVSTGADEYIWFALPVSYGIPTIKTNGFNGGLSLQATISFTNASGFVESYNVYRSDNHNLGLTVVDIT